MIFPNRVKILGRYFKVRVISGKRVAELTGNHGAVGGMNFLKKEILVDKELPVEDQLITFLHECHHAISYITGHSQVTDEKMFEVEAECYGSGFADVFEALLKVNK